MDVGWIKAAVKDAAQARGDAGTWYALIEALLQGCAVRQAPHAAAIEGPSGILLRCIKGDVLAEGKARVAAAASVQVPRDVEPALTHLVDEHAARWDGAPEAGAAAVAWALAQAVDEVHHERFVARLRAYGRQQVLSGRAYPVHRSDPRRMINGVVNTNPERLWDDDVTATDHVRIAWDRAVETHEFVIDWDLYDRLSVLSGAGQLRIAACQPSRSLDDYDIRYFEVGGEPRFRNTGPVDRRGQESRVIAQLEAAIASRAHIVVFPEYAVPVESWDRLDDRLADEGAAARDGQDAWVPALVVGGTGLGQRPHDERWRNEGRLLAPMGAARFEADSTPNSVGYIEKCYAAVIEGHREDLGEASRKVHVFRTPGFAVAVLLCRDAMSVEILRTLGHLGVNLCLVPSMTPVTTSLLELVASLTATSQAVITFVNTPGDWNTNDVVAPYRALAAFHGPYAGCGRVEVPSHDDRPRRAPTVWTFDVSDRAVTVVDYATQEDGNN